MLIEPGKLLTIQRSVNEHCVKSIMVGIILGDFIPKIRVAEGLELQLLFEDIGLAVPDGLLIDGNHRAKAYALLGIQVDYHPVDVPSSFGYMDSFTLNNIYVVDDQQFFDTRRAQKYFRPLDEKISQMPLKEVAKLSKQQLQEFPEYRQNAL